MKFTQKVDLSALMTMDRSLRSKIEFFFKKIIKPFVLEMTKEAYEKSDQ